MAFRPASVICSLATSLPARARDDALRRGRGEPGVNQKFSQCFVNPITLPCVSRPTLDLLVTSLAPTEGVVMGKLYLAELSDKPARIRQLGQSHAVLGSILAIGLLAMALAGRGTFGRVTMALSAGCALARDRLRG
jgi:hypothetical protein